MADRNWEICEECGTEHSCDQCPQCEMDHAEWDEMNDFCDEN